MWLASCSEGVDPAFARGYASGSLLYQQHCGGCHGTAGEGLKQLIPPLAGSDYLADKKATVCAIKNGLKGPIVVNNKTYNLPMPGNKTLLDEDIAAILIYINAAWSTDKQVFTRDSVNTWLRNCN